MSDEHPAHWTPELKRLGALAQRSPLTDLQASLALAAEMAELRKALTEERVEMSVAPSWSPDFGRKIVDAVPSLDPELVQSVSSFEDQRTPEELTMEAIIAVDQQVATLRFVGWYCPGGHEVQATFHGTEKIDSMTAETNVRLEDPCLYSVPMYVLVKS